MFRPELRLRDFPRALVKLLSDLRDTLTVVAAVIFLSVATQLAMEANLVSRTQLAVSRTNLLGTFTGIFAHYDTAHLLANVLALAFFVGAFLFTSFPYGSEERMRRGRWFAWLLLPIAVGVNVVCIILSPQTSSGASGLVYAGFGIAFAYFLLNTEEDSRELVKHLRQETRGPDGWRPGFRAVWWLTWNAVLFVFFGYYAGFNQALLFGVGDPTVNSVAHVLGFAVGASLTLGQNRLRRRLPSRKG